MFLINLAFLFLVLYIIIPPLGDEILVISEITT